MGKTLLILRLEGVLQSWGDHSKWDTRDSGDFPSKSGVVGLLACALGLERDDPEIAELSANLHMAVRADRPGIRMLDFHTVRGNPLYNAEGKARANNTVVSYRWYLQDASFLVVIDLPEAWRERVIEALQHPVWPIYLGRKSCVPSRPVLEETTASYIDLMDAIRHYPVCKREEDGPAPQSLYYECEIPGDSTASYTRADERISEGRSFALRSVHRGMVTREVQDVSDKN